MLIVGVFSGLTRIANGTINPDKMRPSEKLNIPTIINAVPVSNNAAMCKIYIKNGIQLNKIFGFGFSLLT